MGKLQKLRQQLADLKAEGIKLLDQVEEGGVELAESGYDDVKAQIDAKQAEIEREERLAEERRQMEAIPALRPARDVAVHDPNPATTFGFKDVGEFAVAVRRASASVPVIDSRLYGATPANTHTGGAESGEGFEVPPEFRDRIFEVVTEMDEFGPLVDEEPTSKREVKMLADETTPWGTSGIQAYWRNEGNQMTASKLSTQPRTVPLHELYAFVLATDELLEDAPRLAARVTRGAGRAIAWKKNDAMLYGSGAGQPLGWMNASALVTVPKESGQAADTIDDQNVLKMYARHLTVPGDSPFWLANQNILPQLATLQIGDRPMWTPPNGLAGAPNGFLLGLPIRFSEHAKTLGSLGDLQLVSPQGYYALRRQGGPAYAQSMHLYFDYGIEAFRWTFRFGGQPHLSAPVSPANGSDTKSHFVALAERA